VLAGLAGIVGPPLSGQLARFTDWRGVFLFLAGTGVLILAACLLVVRETLPAEMRVKGG
jgi:MFS transporter, DHA1 family, multidrug resistance protein